MTGLFRRIAAWPFKRRPAPSPRAPFPKDIRLEAWANYLVDAGTGVGMLLSQDANKILRHCRIGRVSKIKAGQ